MKNMVHPLKNILNRLRWDTSENAADYMITYRHRGAPGDMKTIRASSIAKLGKSYFTTHEPENDDESTIPFHRILEIRRTTDGSIVWLKRQH